MPGNGAVCLNDGKGDERDGKEEGIRSSNNCFLDSSWNSGDHAAEIYTFPVINRVWQEKVAEGGRDQ